MRLAEVLDAGAGERGNRRRAARPCGTALDGTNGYLQSGQQPAPASLVAAVAAVVAALTATATSAMIFGFTVMDISSNERVGHSARTIHGTACSRREGQALQVGVDPLTFNPTRRSRTREWQQPS